MGLGGLAKSIKRRVWVLRVPFEAKISAGWIEPFPRQPHDPIRVDVRFADGTLVSYRPKPGVVHRIERAVPTAAAPIGGGWLA